METTDSMSESQPTRAFYLPAMGALSNVPGRVGRAVVAAGRDRSSLLRGRPSPEPSRAFYLPAMGSLTSAPGHVGRWATAHLRDRGPVTRAAGVLGRVPEFYLPATFRR